MKNDAGAAGGVVSSGQTTLDMDKGPAVEYISYTMDETIKSDTYYADGCTLHKQQKIHEEYHAHYQAGSRQTYSGKTTRHNDSGDCNGSSWDEADFTWSDQGDAVDSSGSSAPPQHFDWIDSQYVQDGYTTVPYPDLSEQGWLGESGGGGAYPAGWIYHYATKGVNYSWDTTNWGNPVHEEAQVSVSDLQVKLFTGGKKQVGHKSLFCLQPTAVRYDKPPDGPWQETPQTQEDASRLHVLGKPVGSDGLLWIALDDGAEVDCPITAPDKHYNAGFSSVQKYTLTHQTECTAAGNTNNARTTIGIGEVVDFGGMPGNTTWSVSGKGIISSTNGSGTVFTASMSPGSATVTAHIDDVTIPTSLNIVAPNGIQVVDHYDNAQGWASGTNRIGADTKYLLNILPTTVSFKNVSFRENIPAHSIAWPDGITDNFTNKFVYYGPANDCEFVNTDDIADFASKWNIFNGTNFVDFSFSMDWHDEYKNQNGNWIQYVNKSKTTKFNGSNLTGQETYQGVSGGWQGPWK